MIYRIHRLHGTSIALCDTDADSRARKLADGSAWWNAILPVWILCLRNAKRAAVELPRSLLDSWLVWPVETSITNLWWYGAKWSKTSGSGERAACVSWCRPQQH